jgi:ABC-type phosphate transport system permease subunit
MSRNWQEWESELLDRERQWETTPHEEEVSVWWNILGTLIIMASAAMVMAAIWECIR